MLDHQTIGFADLGGNRQYISLGNLQHDDRVALIIVDWRARRRLKIMGRVSLVDAQSDPSLVARLAIPGYGVAERAYLIRVAAFDWNCPQHLTERIPRAEAEQQLAVLRAEITRLRQQAPLPSASLAHGDGPLTLVVRALRPGQGSVASGRTGHLGRQRFAGRTQRHRQPLCRPDGERLHAFYPVGPVPDQTNAVQLHLSPERGPLHAALLPLLQLGTILQGVHLRPVLPNAATPSGA